MIESIERLLTLIISASLVKTVRNRLKILYPFKVTVKRNMKPVLKLYAVVDRC